MMDFFCLRVLKCGQNLILYLNGVKHGQTGRQGQCDFNDIIYELL